MRWLGAARRCHETAVAYAVRREMFGTRAADLGMVQHVIADNEIDIAASRALIWQAAYELDCGRPARSLTSMVKTFVAEATFRMKGLLNRYASDLWFIFFGFALGYMMIVAVIAGAAALAERRWSVAR